MASELDLILRPKFAVDQREVPAHEEFIDGPYFLDNYNGQTAGNGNEISYVKMYISRYDPNSGPNGEKVKYVSTRLQLSSLLIDEDNQTGPPALDKADYIGSVFEVVENRFSDGRVEKYIHIDFVSDEGDMLFGEADYNKLGQRVIIDGKGEGKKSLIDQACALGHFGRGALPPSIDFDATAKAFQKQIDGPIEGRFRQPTFILPQAK